MDSRKQRIVLNNANYLINQQLKLDSIYKRYKLNTSWRCGHGSFLTINNMFNNRPVTQLMNKSMAAIIISISQRF